MQIFTIGYEGMTSEEFRRVLLNAGVDTVVDVRELPLSRKPGFSKTKLREALALSGIGYVHMPKLGCPKSVRHQLKEDGDWGAYKVKFLEYLADQGAELETLAETASSENCALLCFEADATHCHRSLVARSVQKLADFSVVHLSKKWLKKAVAEVA
ncbi:DUF488 family protein [Marinobacter sp. UBA2498]|jgi:uncharacterized protein (DUF488 family)|uniref:DUF488 domain-containing protein n=1 Tax=Marinobacter sp. UBA2498 TaxID=1946813 RepID=UPI00257AF63F|nr:DUF488 domain-containing protein [Marinobacter sp. UBA2498]|tara:strand:- start:2887 stop:3354 length:468 start_codon:yes stop_codon:yes gene_type:complete